MFKKILTITGKEFTNSRVLLIDTQEKWRKLHKENFSYGYQKQKKSKPN